MARPGTICNCMYGNNHGEPVSLWLYFRYTQLKSGLANANPRDLRRLGLSRRCMLRDSAGAESGSLPPSRSAQVFLKGPNDYTENPAWQGASFSQGAQ
jgi:hypothetical protein